MTLVLTNQTIILTIASAVVTGILYWLYLSRLKKHPPAINIRPTPLDEDHRAFFGLLEIAVRDHLTIMPCMPVAHILKPKGWRQKWLLKKIQHRSLDYVLCDRRTLEVKTIVQLESKAPSRAEVKTSQLMHRMFDKAELPLLEYRFKPCFDVPTLKHEVLSAANLHDTLLHGSSPAVQSALEEQLSDLPERELPEQEHPACPKCGSDMQQRRINKGEHAGELCWVCSTYPECRGARLSQDVA
ncbi:DUF2726 domain-containing protein [Endozoicomonadaceae bacterium StTr2]